MKEDIEWLGHTRITLTSDNEPAIVKLLQETLVQLKKHATVEQAGEGHPPPYDHKSNGSIENGVKQVQGMIRTLKLGAVVRIQRRIPATHPVFSWLVEQAT